MATKYIKESALRTFARENGRRVGYDFIHAFDRFIEEKIGKACAVKNGSKKTLDVDVAAFVGIK